MNYKFYYYDDKGICFLSNLVNEKPTFEDINRDSSAIKISIEEKNVENMYNFFKKNTIVQILSVEPKKIEIDYSEIEGQSFYDEENFKKLKELIEQAKEKCNNSIEEFIELNDATSEQNQKDEADNQN